MNFLDYVTNAMTGAAPSQQELMMRDMAAKGLLQQSNMGLTPDELKLLRQKSGAAATPSEIQAIQNERLRRESGAAVSPSELQRTPVQMPEYVSPKGQIPSVQMPQVRRQSGTLPPVQMPSISSGYMQNLINPGMTMQQNYIDPRLIEMMYYRGLLNQ